MNLLPDREGLVPMESPDDPLTLKLRRIAGRAMSEEEWRLQKLSYIRSGLDDEHLSLEDIERLLRGMGAGNDRQA